MWHCRRQEHRYQVSHFFTIYPIRTVGFNYVFATSTVINVFAHVAWPGCNFPAVYPNVFAVLGTVFVCLLACFNWFEDLICDDKVKTNNNSALFWRYFLTKEMIIAELSQSDLSTRQVGKIFLLKYDRGRRNIFIAVLKSRIIIIQLVKRTRLKRTILRSNWNRTHTFLTTVRSSNHWTDRKSVV